MLALESALARHVVAALDSRAAFVAEFIGERPSHLRVLSFWRDGALGENFEYALDDMPGDTSGRAGEYTGASDVRVAFHAIPSLRSSV